MQVPKDYIACNIEYFTLVKDVIVMKDNNIEHFKCKNIDFLPKLMYNISMEKDIKDIIISGQRDIADKIANQIMSMEVHQYNTNNIKVTII
ncbi:MAG: hypothetical protein J6A25_06435 [Lachnospiraceae bacterium]|nr:hypothetical protein [Lachnospiraceae bacterium]MBP3905876.1 hypothetical protein [Peptostreptococcaceae bacterium]